MKRLLLLPAAAIIAALVLSACQNGGDPEAYRRNHDNYMRTYEPKTGGPDL
ncbi:MAG TPA: hypothetical protein VFZ16_14010 [Hyphomicrobiaceae bacterium]|jgi:hypothetical protein|nr:hypothetical protein [Hyphomicrobiaceae bacterium]